MSEKLDKLRATLKKEQERRIKLNNRIAVLERRIQEEEAAEVSSMVRTATAAPRADYAGRNVPDQRSPDEQSGSERRSIISTRTPTLPFLPMFSASMQLH